MIKGVIFDLDGVIVSTDEYHYQAWKKLALREGIEFDRKINNRLRGVSRMESLEIILEKSNKKYSDSEKLEMTDYKNVIYKKLLDNLTPKDILDNALEVLDFLRNMGILIAIGSSSKNTKRILDKIGLLEAFNAIADGTDIKKSKPDPEVFLVAAERLGLEPQSCLVIEDAIAGIEAAKNGYMYACAINDAIKSEKADFKIKNLKEIEHIVLEHNKN